MDKESVGHMSRTKMTLKNVLVSNMATVLTSIVGFVVRTVFIRYLDVSYLGINGLFTNILGVLSFAELGFGTAINFSLYKPVANGDEEKIKSLVRYYQKVYRIIACIITTIGLLVVPFLPSLIAGDPGISMQELYLFYLIFLFNTVIGYFVSYKFCIVNAEQKNYIFTIIDTTAYLIINALQLIVLVLFQNYVSYILVSTIVGVLRLFYTSYYLNRKYPILTQKNIAPIPKEELQNITKNVKALVWHKIGEVSIYQTDNIIISAFVGITSVGIISNYQLLITAITRFTSKMLDAVIPSLGNFHAVEGKEKLIQIFNAYRFVASSVYTVLFVGFYFLLSPMITVWIGEEMLVSNVIVFLILLDLYMAAHRTVVNNIKTACGVFAQDQYISLIQAIVNIATSVLFVNLIGLPGVYVGTICQCIVGNVCKATVVYKHILHKNPLVYFLHSVKYLLTLLVTWTLCYVIRAHFWMEMNLLGILVFAIVVVMVSVGCIGILLGRSKEMAYLRKNLALLGKRK